MKNNHVFIEKLRSSGLRPTKQRIEICKLLFDRKDTFHFSISDLKNNLENKKKIASGSINSDFSNQILSIFGKFYKL